LFEFNVPETNLVFENLVQIELDVLPGIPGAEQLNGMVEHQLQEAVAQLRVPPQHLSQALGAQQRFYKLPFSGQIGDQSRVQTTAESHGENQCCGSVSVCVFGLPGSGSGSISIAKIERKTLIPTVCDFFMTFII
jgi:hypothetical protein